MHGSLGAVEDVGTEHTGKGSLTVRRETCENKDEYSARINTRIGERTVSLDTLLLGSSHVTPPTNLQENGPVSTVKHHLPSRPSFVINPLPPRAPSHHSAVQNTLAYPSACLLPYLVVVGSGFRGLWEWTRAVEKWCKNSRSSWLQTER